MNIFIVKPEIKWNGRLQPFYSIKLSIDSLALHHMAHPTWNFYDVDRAHKNNGWIGIGYNWWIAFDGTIYEGRGFNKGAGVLNHNSHILSIGFQGDYERVNKEMPKAQYDAGVQLIRWLRQQVPSIKTIDGHKHWNNTACPGKYFPLKQMIEDGWKDEVEETEEEEMRFNKLKDVPEGEFHSVIKELIENGYLKGTYSAEDIENTEVDLSYDMLRLLVINYRAGLYK